MSQRLLMIEDDRRLAGMVSEYLGRSGFSVAHAEDAEQGLAALRREPFDLVLLDLMLPDADGLDLCPAHPQRGGRRACHSDRHGHR
ncbi:MAG: response regulator [Chromatiales bacterium]|nr:response regulator [Chromatiales bacterium]